jgi:acylphosphatase
MVQGVGFRYFVRRAAAALNVCGYTKNLPDGDVEVVAEGGREKLELLLDSLRQGPPMSRVAAVETEWTETERPRFSEFIIRH